MNNEDFINLPVEEIIEHLKNKSPEAEAFLLGIAREVADDLGADSVELFDGTIIKLR